MRDVRWEGRRAWIVPGLACRDGARVPDVMRGEEDADPRRSRRPARRRRARVPAAEPTASGRASSVVASSSFSTYMTGELYAVMKSHSILGRMMEEGAADLDAFASGVQRSGEAWRAAASPFRRAYPRPDGRARLPRRSASYLSGILIGHELREASRGLEPGLFPRRAGVDGAVPARRPVARR